MTVLVDTCVWSLALRRQSGQLSRTERSVTALLHELVAHGQVGMLGPVRQELLSGVRRAPEFARLEGLLAVFPDATLDTADHVEAAAGFNACAARGISGGHIDLLICAAAMRRGWSILTIDPDFGRYQRVLGIALHAPLPDQTP